METTLDCRVQGCWKGMKKRMEANVNYRAEVCLQGMEEGMEAVIDYCKVEGVSREWKRE